VLLLAVALLGGGGQQLQAATHIELGLVIAGALVCAAALLRAPARAGVLPLVAFVALTALTVASIAWSVNPSDSWEEANRALSYLAVFAGAIAAVRLAPQAWRGVLAGIAVACVVIAVHALLTRVAPGWLAEDELYARLREPFGYWNAVGISAACAVPPLLWLAARREGHAALRALAWPALGLVLVCLMLSYSRGALLALLVGLIFWFVAVPLRLRGAAALGAAILGAALPVAFAFSRASLSTDGLPLAARADGGAELGALLVLVVVVLTAAGLLANFSLSLRPRGPRTRRRAGIAVLALLALLALVGLGALAATPEGVGGQVSGAFDELTDVDARAPANTPERLTATASVRARYWDEALDVHADHPFLGTGAGGYATARSRYRSDVLAVRHAHGYVVQVLADLGWAGLLLSLLAFTAWIAAAVQATRRRRAPETRCPALR
jgi:O-antigen ligase